MNKKEIEYKVWLDGKLLGTETIPMEWLTGNLASDIKIVKETIITDENLCKCGSNECKEMNRIKIEFINKN